MNIKTLYIGTNTKMFQTAARAREYVEALRALTKDLETENLQLFVIPSFTSIQNVAERLAGSKIRVGAQNMCWEVQGAYSGEISPLMIKEAGASIVMLGHSERRHILYEDDQMISKKVSCALNNGITPLLCIGETAQDKAYGVSDEVLSTQLKIGLSGVTARQASEIWVAYEPVWAIGSSGVPATEEYIAQRHYGIRSCLTGLFGEEQANRIPILYGGSVNNENAEKIIQAENVDGLFIGRSAWNAQNFNQIIRRVLDVRKNRARCGCAVYSGKGCG